jgi:hypothetical protein
MEREIAKYELHAMFDDMLEQALDKNVKAWYAAQYACEMFDDEDSELGVAVKTEFPEIVREFASAVQDIDDVDDLPVFASTLNKIAKNF